MLVDNHKKVVISTLLALGLVGCGGGSGGNNDNSAGGPGNVTKSLNLDFVAEANSQAIDCGSTVTGLGVAGTDVTFEDARFFIHDVHLIKDTGDEVPVTLDEDAWQNGNVALVDFQSKADKCAGADKNVHDTVSGEYVDDGSVYTGIKFTLGLPSDLNHNNPAAAPSPLNITSLQWNWQAGYKFVRVDVAPVGGITRSSDPLYAATAWNFHLGSTGCTGDPLLGEVVTCDRPNRIEVVLDGFTVDTSEVVFNYGALIENATLSVDEGGAPGCMSGVTDPECASVFAKLGLDIATGQPLPAGQQIFSVR